MSHRTRSRLTAALLTGFASVLMGPLSANADPAMAAPMSVSAAEDSGGSKIMLVMDSSGSMSEPAGGGRSKIAAAKESLNSVIDALPADQELGLRVYGSEIYSRNNPQACTDSKLVVPVGTDNRGRLGDAVGSYEPYGETPIGYALAQAGKDLGDSGRRNIILVSDGESTCDPDPCTVARDLRSGGIDLRVDVVGLDVDGPAREQLRCVADVGGGIYYDTHDRTDLSESLTHIAKRAARPYEVTGMPVTGADSQEQAPIIGDGDWVDQTGIGQGNRYYRIARTMTNSTIAVSAAYRTPGGGTADTDVSLYTPDQQMCGSDYQSESYEHGVLLAAGTTVGAASGEYGEFGDEPLPTNNACLARSELIAVVSMGYSARNVPLELRVSELPEITNPGALPAPEDEPQWTPPSAEPTAQVTGGTSFADPEPLKPGGYRGSIVPGETLTFSVEVGWGEQLNAAAVIDRLSGATTAAGEGGPEAYLDIYGPGRLPAGTTETDGGELADTANLDTTAAAELGQTTGPVTYTNLTSEETPGASEAGDYTITLYLEDTPENASIPVPFDLGIDLTGTPADPPAFDERPIGAEPSDDSVADDGTSTADDSAGSETATADRAGAPGGSDRVSGISLLLGGLGTVLVAAGGLVFLRRRRSDLSF